MLNIQNYNILCELGLQVVNGIVRDQDSNLPVKNTNTGKILIVKEPNTYADYKYYEDFNPHNNFKQLKSLVEQYLNRIAIFDDRYFQLLCIDMKDDQVALVAKNEYEEVRTRYFDKDKIYLCYIDLLFCLEGEYNVDMSIYLKK